MFASRAFVKFVCRVASQPLNWLPSMHWCFGGCGAVPHTKVRYAAVTVIRSERWVAAPNPPLRLNSPCQQYCSVAEFDCSECGKPSPLRCFGCHQPLAAQIPHFMRHWDISFRYFVVKWLKGFIYFPLKLSLLFRFIGFIAYGSCCCYCRCCKRFCWVCIQCSISWVF